MNSIASKKKWLEKSRLCAIIDRKAAGERSVARLASALARYRVDMVQYRDKDSDKRELLETAISMRKALKNTRTLFIVNDYLDVAKIADSDGIHIGQSDINIGIARKILGKDKIIGVSCHTLFQAIDAQKRGADYIGVGPVFFTPLKPKAKPIGLTALAKIKRRIKIPLFAIGGINQENVSRISSAGAKRIAVSSAIIGAKNPALEIRTFKKLLEAQ